MKLAIGGIILIALGVFITVALFQGNPAAATTNPTGSGLIGLMTYGLIGLGVLCLAIAILRKILGAIMSKLAIGGIILIALGVVTMTLFTGSTVATTTDPMAYGLIGLGVLCLAIAILRKIFL